MEVITGVTMVVTMEVIMEATMEVTMEDTMEVITEVTGMDIINYLIRTSLLQPTYLRRFIGKIKTLSRLDGRYSGNSWCLYQGEGQDRDIFIYHDQH